MEPALVVPLDPAGSRQLELLERAPRTLLADELGLVETDDGLSQRIVVRRASQRFQERNQRALVFGRQAEY